MVLLSAIAGATNAQYTFTLPTTPTYYVMEATYKTCTVRSNARLAWDSLFIAPVLTVNADTNSNNKVCQGSQVDLSTSSSYGSYDWYRNNTFYQNGSSGLTLFGAWQNGNYRVDAYPTGWPEISLSSNSIQVNILQLIQPVLSGANYFDYFCSGDTILVALTDEGYQYTWYLHDTIPYGPADTISVSNGVYRHPFTQSTYLIVVAEHQGCQEEKQLNLRSYSAKSLSLDLSNFRQRYLCDDSTVSLSLSSFQLADYQDFQWHQEVNGVWVPMVGEDSSVLVVNMPGLYRLHAVPVACTTAVSQSFPYEIFSYQDREPYIYAFDNVTCLGDTVEGILSGGSDWTAIQWLQADIQFIPQVGYGYQFLPLANNTGADKQPINTWGTYVVKAKHSSCPNGLKVTSNQLVIKPRVNPQVQVLTPLDTLPKHIGLWDSIAFYGGCQDQPVTLAVDGHYNTYQWFAKYYTGDDDYSLGDSILGQNSDTANVLADVQWITVVVDSMGCIGHSTPILLDTYAFLPPGIASYNNGELCNPGDSTLLHLGFPGQWGRFEWVLDSIPIPNSNNDSIWAKDTGVYVLNAYPERCPNMLFSSGIGPYVRFLYADILENDSVIYAVPQLGFYTYQWYFNGNPIAPHDPQTPWLLYKNQLQDGVYTVEVSNGIPCTNPSS